MAFDFKKEYKEYYLPPQTPTIVEIPPANYVAVRGKGDPNDENGEYKASIELLYGIAFTIKMSKMGDHRIDGYFDFVVPPLEGLWWSETGEVDYGRKEDFHFISMLRLPDFVTKEDFDWAAEFGLTGVNYQSSSQYDTPARVRNAKYLSSFKIRMFLEPGAYMRLWIKYDENPLYEYMGERRGNEMKTFVLPVVPKRCDHLRFKLTGHGGMKIYDLSRVMEVGGDG